MTWTYEIDPAYAPNGKVPPEAVVAAAPSAPDGSITGPWTPNPNYRPSVIAQLLKQFPSDDFLRAFGAYLRGELSPSEFQSAFRQAMFYVLATPAEDALVVLDQGSGPAYSLYTTLRLFAEGAVPPVKKLFGAQIVPLAQNCEGLLVNSTERGALWIPMADLRDED